LSAAFIGTPDQRYGTRCSTLIITEKTARQPITHVYERSFDAAGAAVSLRRVLLRNWPPRYVEDDAQVPVAQAVVSEHEVATA
jgi:uncharacterized protein with NRDE domain